MHEYKLTVQSLNTAVSVVGIGIEKILNILTILSKNILPKELIDRVSVFNIHLHIFFHCLKLL